MYSLMNWPIYLVWDRYQYDVVRRYSNPSSEIKIVGPIVFASSGAPLPRINGPSVGIFDVQPHRVSQYVKYALPIEYYVPSVATAFLSDIYDVASIHDVNVVYKSKRNLGRLVHPEFRNFLPSYLDRPSIVNVPADTSAFEVIEKVDVVIAAPFTSVALIAKSMGKPVAYYDPIGIIKPHDPAAHGVCVIGGKWELIEWFDRVLHTKGCDHTL
jgi:polysaccharide biosynthesis PFTS motif protein